MLFNHPETHHPALEYPPDPHKTNPYPAAVLNAAQDPDPDADPDPDPILQNWG